MRCPKRIIILIFCIIGLLNVANYSAWGQETDTLASAGRGLSLAECIRFAIKNSFEVKLARLDFLIAETEQGVAESVFDAVLSADVSYENDKREPLSVFGADHQRTNKYSFDASKKLPSGTELSLALSDTRSWTNSGFVARNPAHTAELELQARQPLAKNIFGFIDRRNISVTSLAIQNADLLEQALEQRALQRDLELAHQVQLGLLPQRRPEVIGSSIEPVSRGSSSPTSTE